MHTFNQISNSVTTGSDSSTSIFFNCLALILRAVYNERSNCVLCIHLYPSYFADVLQIIIVVFREYLKYLRYHEKLNMGDKFLCELINCKCLDDRLILHRQNSAEFLPVQKENLSEKIVKWKENNSFENDFAVAVLKEITHLMHYLHSRNIMTRLTVSNIQFFPTERGIVLVNRDSRDGVGKLEREDVNEDLSCLYDLFGTVLRKPNMRGDHEANSFRCSQPDLANDLLVKISKGFVSTNSAEEGFSAKDVLHHPFFWSERKTISVIKNIVQYIQDSKNQRQKLETKMNDLWKNKSGWIQELKLKDYEIKAASHRGNILQEDDIINELERVCKVYRNSYDSLSFYDLLRFFRNECTHFWERPKNIRDLYVDSIGLWNFLVNRFPLIVWITYQAVQDFFQEKELKKYIFSE